MASTRTLRQRKENKESIYKYFNDSEEEEGGKNQSSDSDESYNELNYHRKKKGKRGRRAKFFDDEDEAASESGEDDLENEDFFLKLRRMKKPIRKVEREGRGKKKFRRSKLGKKPAKGNLVDSEIGFLLKWKKEEGNKNFNSALCKNINVESILNTNLLSFAEDIQALFLNIDFSIPSSLNFLKKFEISKKLMKNGILFIWSEVRLLSDLMNIMEEKSFKYVEHFTIVNLCYKNQNNQEDNDETASDEMSRERGFGEVMRDLEKKRSLKAIDLLLNEKDKSFFLTKSKRVLLMFRRFDPKDCQLELRHQRTCDVLFDLVDKNDKSKDFLSTKNYIYHMIETLLPKAMVLDTMKDAQKKLKMMELNLCEDEIYPRNGWVQITQVGGQKLKNREKENLVKQRGKKKIEEIKEIAKKGEKRLKK